METMHPEVPPIPAAAEAPETLAPVDRPMSEEPVQTAPQPSSPMPATTPDLEYDSHVDVPVPAGNDDDTEPAASQQMEKTARTERRRLESSPCCSR